MSDEFTLTGASLGRPLNVGERRVVEVLLDATPEGAALRRALDSALVVPMNDGGMGSLRFLHADIDAGEVGRLIAEAEFRDADGVPVSAFLDLDRRGRLFELDMFKGDSTPLLRWPEVAKSPSLRGRSEARMLDRPQPVTPDSPALDERALALALSGHHFIGGRFVPASSGRTFAVVDPATGEEVGRAAEGDAADVEVAVREAARAQKEWARVPARRRGALVHACAALLTAHTEELARLIALETGKALRTESRVEAGVVADIFAFFGGLGGELKGESVPFAPDVLSVTVREPLGVVGAIIPWNVPMLLMALKVAPALVAGNAVVVKSAEEAPLTVLRICELLARVLPHGVFNMLSGYGPDCGAPLVSHPLVRKVTFTGSVEVGRIVSKTAAEKLIPVTLELGGKSPMIVFADCDFEKTVMGAVTSMRFTRQGQSCTAASRIFVERPIYDRFVEALAAKVDAMVMGDPLDERTDIGTIISKDQFAKVEGFIAEGLATPGATGRACSAMPADPGLKKGLFIRPHIFTGLPRDSRLVQEEIFGPVTCIFPFDDADAVLEAANDSEYGLAASVWTNDLKAGLRLAHRLEAGLVQINQNLVVQANLSYGGVKSSGLGKEASLEAMNEHFTHKKTIMVNYG